MSHTLERWLFWTPRVVGLLFAGFLSIFALDVFGQGAGPGKTILAFLIHLLPTFLVLGALAIAWRWEFAGAILFAALGAYYVFSTWGRFPWSTYLVIAGPPVLVGLLFLIHGLLAPRRGRTRAE